MAFIGDFQQFIGDSGVIHGMTAIGRIYTLEGFAVAADGRKSRSADNSAVIDTAQKIFALNDSHISIAYTFAGTVGLTPDDNPDEATFDFIIETRKALATICADIPRTLKEFVVKLSSEIVRSLRDAKSANAFQSYPEGPLGSEVPDSHIIAHILIDGYYRGSPGRVNATFVHKNQELLATEVNQVNLDYVMTGYGSEVIVNLLYCIEDGWISKYRISPQNSATLTLKEGIERVKGYVAACSDMRALELDREHCAAIGGHLHLATITPSDGFKWIIPPI
jgi:hypothetical protein